MVVALLEEIVVDLARAEDQFLHAVGLFSSRSIIWDDPLEAAALVEVLERTPSQRMAEQRLWRKVDQRLAEAHFHLAAQTMEEIRGRGQVGHNPVDVHQLAGHKVGITGIRIDIRIIVAHLQEALNPPGGVLRAHAFHAVRQEQHNTGLAHPLGLATGYESVDDALGCVAEVPELALPHDQRMRTGHGVAVFESQDGALGQRAVGDGVGRLVRVQVIQRIVHHLVARLMVQHVVPMREGAAFHILAGQADVDALL